MGHRNLPFPDAQPWPWTQGAAIFLLAQFAGRFLIYNVITEQQGSAPVGRARTQALCEIFWRVQCQGVRALHGPGRHQAQSQGGPTRPHAEAQDMWLPLSRSYPGSPVTFRVLGVRLPHHGQCV